MSTAVAASTTPPKRKQHGRCSTYSLEVDNRICELLVHGQTIVQICRLPSMPSRMTVYRWTLENPGFETRFAAARAAGGASVEHEAVTIMDECRSGKIDSAVAHVLLRGLHWRAKVLNPAVYGERVDVAHSGHVGFGLTIVPRQLKAIEHDGPAEVVHVGSRKPLLAKSGS